MKDRRILRLARDFSLFRCAHARLALGLILPPIQMVPGPFSLAIKRSDREALTIPLYLSSSLRVYAVTPPQPPTAALSGEDN
jgi:hypothetical protein